MARTTVHPRLGAETLVASALNFPGSSKDIRTPPPEPGQHTNEVLRELGYSDHQISEMRARGVLA